MSKVKNPEPTPALPRRLKDVNQKANVCAPLMSGGAHVSVQQNVAIHMETNMNEVDVIPQEDSLQDIPR
jgi:hypothetical protein